jgi:hypothetical protein
MAEPVLGTLTSTQGEPCHNLCLEIAMVRVFGKAVGIFGTHTKTVDEPCPEVIRDLRTAMNMVQGLLVARQK